ncbi:conserved hypothetical protein [Neisseria gonorrhoeae DGI2]|nr:conserved hypothetical protein [Neisseria gonorrhoeae DGI2]
MCLKNFQTAFFSEQNRIFFIHNFPKACPPKKGRIGLGLGRSIHLILRMDDVLFSSK